MTVVFVNASNYVPAVEKKIIRKMYCDPSHGWLAVKIEELEKLGLMDKITAFSYVNGKTAYLEEDVDMETYLKVMEADGYHITVLQTFTEKKSYIRTFSKFPSQMPLPQPVEVEAEMAEEPFEAVTENTPETPQEAEETVSDVVEYIDSQTLDEVLQAA